VRVPFIFISCSGHASADNEVPNLCWHIEQ